MIESLEQRRLLAGDVLNETFDSVAGFTTSHPFFSDNGNDYFGISDGAGQFDSGSGLAASSTDVKAYTAFSGNFLAMEDLDGDGGSAEVSLTWSGLNISGKNGLDFAASFAEFFDSPGDIDSSDFIRVETQIDAGGFINILEFRGNGDGTNEVFAIDTNADGVGDGAVLGNAASSVGAAIAGTGNLLDLRITMRVEAGDEDFAMDGVMVSSGAAVPGVAITQTAASTSVNEEGPTSDTFDVVLNTEPTADVTITVTAPDGETTVDVGTLTFTGAGGATPWDTPQTVTVTAVNDSDVEGAHSGAVQFAVTSGDTDYSGLSVPDLVVNIADNDAPSTTAALINEFVANHAGSDTDAFVEIFVPTATGITDISTLTLILVDGDAGSNGVVDSVIPLTNTDSNGYFVANLDPENDHVNFLLVENFTGALMDDLDTDNNGILDAMPWTSIIDSVATSDGQVGDTSYTTVDLTPGLDGNTFSYGGASRIPNGTDTDSTADWVRNNFSGAGLPSFPGVTVMPGEGINTPGAANMIEALVADVTITETDNSTDVVEGGATDTFTAVLPTEPTSDVTVTFTISDGESTTDVASVTFTPSGGASPWNVAQTVTVAAVDDSDVEGIHGSTIAIATTSADLNYNGLNVPSIGVTVTDNDGSSGLNPGDLVINEIMQNPAAVFDSNGEYIEIFNTTAATIDINGFFIKDAGSESHQIANGGPLNVPAGGFIVLGRNMNSATNGGVTVDYQYDGIFLGNGTDVVIIEDNFALEIDRVAYDGGTTFPSPTGASMELIPAVLGNPSPGTANDIGSNWQISTTALSGGDLGTPGAQNSGTVVNASSFVLINEILFDTAGTDAPNEYVEIRGDANTVVPDNTYLLDIEGDVSSGFGPGKVSNIFDLSGLAFGSNGYLVLAQGTNTYSFDPSANVLTSSTADFGGFSFFSSDVTLNEIENATNTFLLVESATAPTIFDDIDDNDDGVADTLLATSWTLLDSVAVSDNDGGDQTYSPIVFTYFDTISPPLGYVARIGNSTGMTAADWVGAELGGAAPNFTLSSNTTPASKIGEALDHIGASNAANEVIITESGGSTEVNEAGPTSDTFDVSLTSEPANDVTITITIPDGETTVDLGTLTFTQTGGAAPWDVPQTVAVTAVDDTDSEGPHAGVVSFTTSSLDTNYDALSVSDLSVSITDDDGLAPAAVINEFVADHPNTDSDAFIEIFLPGATGATDLSALTLVELDGDSTSAGIIDSITTLGTTDASGYFVVPEDVENGAVSFLLVTGFAGTVGDDLDADNDGVLDTPLPWSSLVDAVATSDGGSTDFVYGGVDLAPGLDGDPNQFGGASRIPNGTDTNTTADWKRNDFDGAGLPSFPGVVADPGEAVNTPGTANSFVDLVPEVTIVESDGSTELNEAGPTSDTFTVSLVTEPTADVTITIVITDGQTTVDSGTLTFTTSAGATPWNVAQTVTVTAVNDVVVEANHTGTIGFSVSSTDLGYDGLAVANVVASIVDNDGSSGLAPGDLIVNEIMQNPASVDDGLGEYFEIYNTTASTIDINSFVIKDAATNSHTINNGGPLNIAAGGYLVLGINGDFGTNGGVTVDYVYSGFNLGNGDDEVIIEDNFGLVLDEVAYDGGTNFPDPGGASMELKPSVLAGATPEIANDSGSNWQVAIAPLSGGDTGTPGAVNSTIITPVLVTGVVINDGVDLQRSQITSVTVNFDGLVDHSELTSAAFELTNIDTTTLLGASQLLVSPSDTGGATSVVITFGTGASVDTRIGAGVLGNSLSDGNYELKVLATGITGLDADHVFGGHDADVPAVDNDDFFRLYGDIDGDGDTDSNDLNDSFAPAFFSVNGEAAYVPALDGEGDGDVEANDLNDFFGPRFFAVRQ